MKIKVQNKYSLAFIELDRFSFAIVPQSCVYFTEEKKGAPASLSPRPHKKGQQALHVYSIANFVPYDSKDSKRSEMTPNTEDGSTDVVPQILYGPNLILGVFGSCMF